MEKNETVAELVTLSDELEESGDLEGALAALTRAIAKASDDPWPFARRGRIYRIRKQWRKAIADFDSALALKFDSPTTLFMRGTCRATIGDFDGAIVDLERCIQFQPSSADAYWNLGTIHSFRNNVPEAIVSYSNALKLAPERYPGLVEEIAELKRLLQV
jgi:tetratricopeptide (TPR) repeat protein